jgi:hypothetical protein
MRYCQLLLPFPVDQFWLYIWHGIFHNHLKLLWKFQTCVCFLISYGWHRDTHTLLDMRLYQQGSSFLSNMLLINVVSCWDNEVLGMNEWMNECEAMIEWYWQVKIEVLRRKSVPVLLWLSQIRQIGMALNFHVEEPVTARHRCSLIMFCHCHFNWKLKRKIRGAHVKSF